MANLPEDVPAEEEAETWESLLRKLDEVDEKFRQLQHERDLVVSRLLQVDPTFLANGPRGNGNGHGPVQAMAEPGPKQQQPSPPPEKGTGKYSTADDAALHDVLSWLNNF